MCGAKLNLSLFFYYSLCFELRAFLRWTGKALIRILAGSDGVLHGLVQPRVRWLGFDGVPRILMGARKERRKKRTGAGLGWWSAALEAVAGCSNSSSNSSSSSSNNSSAKSL